MGGERIGGGLLGGRGGVRGVCVGEGWRGGERGAEVGG